MLLWSFTGATLLIVGSSLLMVAAAIWRYFTNELRHVPGPWHTRITHIPWKKAVLTGQRLKYIHAMHQKYGDTVRLSPDSVAASDLESHKQLFAIASGWNKSKWYPGSFQMPRIAVFAETDPKLHADRRKLFAPRFTKSSLHDFWEPTVREQITLAVHQIVNEIRNKGTSDIMKWFILMANDIGAALMFGETFGMLEAGEKNEYIETIENFVKAGGISYEIPIIETIGKLLPFPNFFNNGDRLLGFAGKAVENAREGSTARNIFYNIITKSDKENSGLTDLDVRCEASSLLVGASDTIASSLTWIVWEVMRRSDIRASLEAELDTLPSDFTDKELETLPYLNAVIAESLRLNGPASGALPREVPQGGAMLNGYALPAGIDVQIQAYTLHRREDIWENPSLFDPTRFLRPQSEVERAAYLPFSAGSRRCLGMNLAQMELRYGLALIMLAALGDPNTGAKRLCLADSVKDEHMEPLDFFIIKPAGHKCELTACT